MYVYYSLHLTTMCLQYKPTVVACFCIHLACKWSRWEVSSYFYNDINGDMTHMPKEKPSFAVLFFKPRKTDLL